MKDNQPRVGLFMTAGILVAIVVGIVVFNTSASDRSAQAGYVTDSDTKHPDTSASSTESAISKSTKATALSDAPVDHNSSTTSEDNQDPRHQNAHHDTDAYQAAPAQQGGGSNYNLNSDPYAPQHAVVGTAQPSNQSTRVFRPTNVVPTTVMPTTAVAGPEAQATTGTTGGANDSAQPGAAGTPDTAGTAGAQNSEPTTAAPATEPTTTATPGGQGGPGDQGAENPASAAESAAQSAASEAAQQASEALRPMGLNDGANNSQNEPGTPQQQAPAEQAGQAGQPEPAAPEAPAAPSEQPQEAAASQPGGFSSDAQHAWQRWVGNFRH
ncbi:hypothetical protein [Corynebacterium gottingense]|uniref:Uncharacterized protein n=1 Tax=Corynebacterium gottingense TaxID=2041036 RepID=A0ABX9UGN4_9CORY|nr:hypothetical protein [Corynebacterium gottingense]RMD16229.1 hypothetical protein EAW56_11860 [Corynebacterium gottingense]WJZ14841.1 hypothetical protein CGOTTB_02820 [Corynebacterium gottingense]